MSEEPKQSLPEQAAGAPWHMSCGCVAVVVTFLLLCWLGSPVGRVLTALAGWIGRQ